MTPRLARRLLILTGTALAGYALGRSTTAFGWTPAVLLTTVCVTAWCAGWLRSHALHSAVTATAVRERDDACAIAVSIHEGASYQPLPAYLDQADADPLHRHLRSVPCQHTPACGDVR